MTDDELIEQALDALMEARYRENPRDITEMTQTEQDIVLRLREHVRADLRADVAATLPVILAEGARRQRESYRASLAEGKLLAGLR
jgi:peptide subunit release factor 1 (eRF1)